MGVGDGGGGNRTPVPRTRPHESTGLAPDQLSVRQGQRGRPCSHSVQRSLRRPSAGQVAGIALVSVKPSSAQSCALGARGHLRSNRKIVCFVGSYKGCQFRRWRSACIEVSLLIRGRIQYTPLRELSIYIRSLWWSRFAGRILSSDALRSPLSRPASGESHHEPAGLRRAPSRLRSAPHQAN